MNVVVREALRDLGEEALKEVIVGIVRGVDRAEGAVRGGVPGCKFMEISS